MNNNLENLKLIDNWYYPGHDDTMHNYLNSDDRINESSKVSKYCKNKNLCVQAGGNIGFYPKFLSKIFEKVITFEPEPLNYQCLLLNTQDCSNIESHQAALGAENKNVSLVFDNNNCGGHRVEGDGNIKMVRLDDLELKELDLLYLDCEGYEGEAISGALQTIKKFNPIICVELAWKDYTGLLSDLGYTMVEKIDVNGVFEYGG